MQSESKKVWKALPWRSRAVLFAKFHLAAAPGWLWACSGLAASLGWMWASMAGYDELGAILWRGPGLSVSFGGLMGCFGATLVALKWIDDALWPGRQKKLGWMWGAAALACALGAGALARMDAHEARSRVEHARMVFLADFERARQMRLAGAAPGEKDWAGSKAAIRGVENGVQGISCSSTCWAFDAALGEMRRRAGEGLSDAEIKKLAETGFSASLSVAVSNLEDWAWLMFVFSTPAAFAAVAGMARLAESAKACRGAGAARRGLSHAAKAWSPAALAKRAARAAGFAYESMGRWSDQIVERGLSDSKMLARIEAAELEKTIGDPAVGGEPESRAKRL